MRNIASVLQEGTKIMADTFTPTNEMEEANHTEMDLDIDPIVLVESLDSDYDAYRDGDFGRKLGFINFNRAKLWSVTHFIVAVLIEIVSITLACLIQINLYGVNEYTRNVFAGFSISTGIIALATSCCSLYFVKCIATMKRPLFVLLLVLILAFFECLLATSAIITTIVVVPDIQGDRIGLFLPFCFLLLPLLLADIVTALAWLFQWWRCCECCQDFNSLCIFEREQTLAVASPVVQATDQDSGPWIEFMKLCWAAYRPDWRIII